LCNGAHQALTVAFSRLAKRCAMPGLSMSQPKFVAGLLTHACASAVIVNAFLTNDDTYYYLQTAWNGNRFVFSFRDEKDRSGTLVLLRPKMLSSFGVDPRNQPDRPNGPVLYKEWRLTSKATGTGVFTAGLGAGQALTLVLQGRGNITTPSFSHWMLVM
jgi:hypothetical protein